jgi:Ras-like protein family protein 10B
MCDQPIQIAVLGDKAVGKTAIVRQWLYNDFSTLYSETNLASYHFTSIFNGQRLFHIRIIDTPRFDDINNTDPQQEWVRMYCFRRAHLFLLVFDINREESFNYIKQIYREIVRVRLGYNHHHHHHQHSYSHHQSEILSELTSSNDDDDPVTTISTTYVPVIVVANKVDLITTDLRFSNITLANFRDIQQYVKKNFKANTIQCSAKYHWHLVLLFKEVCRMLETVEDTVAKQAAQQARRRLHQQQQHHGKNCHVM